VLPVLQQRAEVAQGARAAALARAQPLQERQELALPMGKDEEQQRRVDHAHVVLQRKVDSGIGIGAKRSEFPSGLRVKAFATLVIDGFRSTSISTVETCGDN
jgi:hypothetical protein